MVLIINMSERKRQAPLSEKEKQGEKKEEEEDDKNEASEQDMQIEVSEATNAIRSHKNAIEPVPRRIQIQSPRLPRTFS